MERAFKNSISEMLNTQGPNIISHTETDATIDIATFSNINSYEDLNIDSNTELMVHDLSFVDFVSCFYASPGSSFVINYSNKNFKPLSLVNQTYKSTDGMIYYWNLYNQVLKAYSNKYNVSENLISSNKKIMLTKEVFSNTSLATNCGSQNTLSWDQVILALETTRKIQYTGDMDHNANVIFKIHYIFYSKSLDINISAVFSYRTSVPGYKNIYINEDFNIPVPYSKKEVDNIIQEPIYSVKPNVNLRKAPIETEINDEQSLLTRQILRALRGEEDEEEEEDEHHSVKW